MNNVHSCVCIVLFYLYIALCSPVCYIKFKKGQPPAVCWQAAGVLRMHMNDHTAILSARKGFRMVFLCAQFCKRTVCPDIHFAKSGIGTPFRLSLKELRSTSFVDWRTIKESEGAGQELFPGIRSGPFRDGVVTVGIKI